MKKKKDLQNKILVIGILFLFMGTVIVPTISGFNNKSKDISILTFYTFDKTGTKKYKIELPTLVVEDISRMFDKLKNKITLDPYSNETQSLKKDFVETVDAYGLLSSGVSKEYVISLLNPRWNKGIGDLSPFSKNSINPRQSSASGSAFFCSMAGGGNGMLFPPIILPRPRLVTVWTAFLDAISIASNIYTGHGFEAGGSQIGTAFGFWGIGLSFAFPGEPAYFGFGGYALAAFVIAEEIETYPPNREPVISDEMPIDGSVNVPTTLSELKFRISDADNDRMDYTVTTSPYIGAGNGNNVIGGTYSIPVSGLNSNTEYSWHVVVSDKEDATEKTFSFKTAIDAPFVSDPSPVDGDFWVPINITELSFRLEDFQGDPMDYTVETIPDIGSGSGTGVGDGIYSVSVSDLEYTKDYSWFVNVTDGKYWTRKVFGFKTQPMMVFDPFDEGWLYRKKITINHSQVAGDLSDFPVLISIVDFDLASKAQADGDDVLFMDGNGIAKRLFHEIERYNDSNGDLVSWVNIPSLSSNQDNSFYLYYGNQYCDTQQYLEYVWDSEFIHIWHLGDSLSDSVGSDDGNNHGTTIVNGKVGKGRDFERDEQDFIDFGDMTQPADSSLTTITWEAWVKPETLAIPIATKYHTGEASSYYIAFQDDGKFRFCAYGGYRIMTNCITENSYSSVDKWFYLTSTLNLGGTNDINIFIDGEEVPVTLSDRDADFIRNLPETDDLGRYRPKAGPIYTDAVIDEVRWSKVIRSDKWIKTSYNTINDPSSFYEIGSEESGP